MGNSNLKAGGSIAADDIQGKWQICLIFVVSIIFFLGYISPFYFNHPYDNTRIRPDRLEALLALNFW